MLSSDEPQHNQPGLARLLRYCHVKTYPAKSYILRAGETNNRLFFILKGSVAVASEDEDEDRELIYAYLNEGQFIGELGIFNEVAEVAANIKTRCQCKLAEILHSRFKHLLKHELQNEAAEILFLIGGQLAARLMMTSRNFRDLAFMDTEGRIARTLLDLCAEPDAKHHPEGIEIRVTRRELSQFVGCSREVVGRVFKELERKKMISSHGKTVIIFQSLALKSDTPKVLIPCESQTTS